MQKYRGTVRVRGTAHDVEVESRLAGRTVIRVDGKVVLDERPIIHIDDFAFQVGGAPVALRWAHVGLRFECHVIADEEVVLPRVDG